MLFYIFKTLFDIWHRRQLCLQICFCIHYQQLKALLRSLCACFIVTLDAIKGTDVVGHLQGFVIQGRRTDSANTDERSGITWEPGHRYDSWDWHSPGTSLYIRMLLLITGVSLGCLWTAGFLCAFLIRSDLQKVSGTTYAGTYWLHTAYDVDAKPVSNRKVKKT